MIDDFEISYVSVGRDILRFGTKSTFPPGESVIIADPDFDLGGSFDDGLGKTIQQGRAGLHFDRLCGTRLEGEWIGKLLDVQPWLQEDALEARLKTSRSPRIVHLATHGFFLEKAETKDTPLFEGAIDAPGRLSGRGMENPMLRSGLALAGANTWINHGTPPEEAEDGLLTAEDVTGLNLLDSDLVVLSACDTGLGEIHVGEGVFGLRRALVLAGATTLIRSLWKVDDLATAILMNRLYENLLEGQRRDEALRKGQIYVRDLSLGEIRKEWLDLGTINSRSGGDVVLRSWLEHFATLPATYRPFVEPYYWGAFICQGDTGPLQSI